MARTAIYARKSTESDDRQVLSLDAQLHWAREACAKLGVREPLVFTEARSAKLPGREVFGQLMRGVNAGRVDTIVCWKADRLARNAADAGAVLFALESKRLTAIVTADGTYAADADSELMLGILLGFSAKYSKDLSKNIRRGMEEKLRRGEWSWNAPVGYKNVRLTGDRATIAVDEATAPYVRQLFELAATGDYSLNDLVAISRDTWKLQKEPRRATSTRLGLSHTTIDHMLHNPFYRGLLVVKGQTYPGVHEPLVSAALFEQVQRVRAERGKQARRPSRRDFVLAGAIRCAACGRMFVGSTSTAKSGKPYTYYICTNKIRRRCEQARLPEPQLMRDVERALRHVRISEADYRVAEQVLDETTAELRRAHVANQARAEATARGIDAQQSRLLDLLLTNAISQADYERKRNELTQRRADAMTLEAGTSLDDRLQIGRAFVSSLLDADSMFAAMPTRDRRIFLRSLGLQITAKGGISHLELAQPAMLIAEHRGSRSDWSLWNDVAKFFLEHVSSGNDSLQQRDAT
jgi:DNA invertase Pin-like site-specific DNA recombinase